MMEARGVRPGFAVAALLLLCAFLAAPASGSAGTYVVGRDDDGVYFQTSRDGSWYIPDEDLRHFAVGERGRYEIRRGPEGRQLVIEGRRTFALGDPADEPDAAAVEAFNASERSRLGTSETPVVIRGNQVLLPVKVTHKGRSQEMLLLLDTGASVLTLHRSAADRLGMTPERTVAFSIADGQSVPAGIVRLTEVRFGPFRKSEVVAGIIDHRNPEAGYDGLLGMNLLRDVAFTIDFDKQVIRWKG